MISYCHKDRPFVVKLADALKARDCAIWFDEGIQPGEDYSGRIQQKIEDAAAVLVVWSSNSCDSKWVKAEGLKAFDLGKKVIPVLKEPCSLHVPFNADQFTNLSDWTFDAFAPPISKIVSALPPMPKQPSSQREPHTTLAEIASFLHTTAKIKVTDRTAIGELSDVYRGEYGRRRLAIKAFRSDRLPKAIKENLLAEVAISSTLNHPSFLRISDVLFDNHHCFIVSDRVEGGQTIARKIEAEGAFLINEVVDILNQLCEAVVEAEVAGLGYLSITPSQVFVKDDRTQLLVQDHIPESDRRKLTRKIARLSPINFARFKTHFGHAGAFWTKDSGPFMPPEYWRDNTWFKNRMEPVLGRELKGEELRRTALHKSHQFALGMMAWTMLEGRVPFTPCLDDADVRDRYDLQDIQEQFFAESEAFSQQVAQARWRTEARALARIIQRMVRHNPAKRWSSTNQVRLLIQALAANYAGDNLDDLIKKAYQVVAHGKYEFYREFYARLFQKRPHLRAKFPPDMSRQHQMLDEAVGQLLNFNQQQSEPTTLTKFVKRHTEFGLSKDDFEEFGNALIESFDAGLTQERGHERMMAALEIVIWPGIYYMIQQCTPTEARDPPSRPAGGDG
jgi:serine/threonine protein kinase